MKLKAIASAIGVAAALTLSQVAWAQMKISISVAQNSHQGIGIDTEQVMVVFKEVGWENWSFAGGRILHA